MRKNNLLLSGKQLSEESSMGGSPGRNSSFFLKIFLMTLTLLMVVTVSFPLNGFSQPTINNLVVDPPSGCVPPPFQVNFTIYVTTFP